MLELGEDAPRLHAELAARPDGSIAYPAATAAGLLWPPLILIAIAVLAVYYMAEQTQILPKADHADHADHADRADDADADADADPGGLTAEES